MKQIMKYKRRRKMRKKKNQVKEEDYKEGG
jgi:hypothetical protein